MPESRKLAKSEKKFLYMMAFISALVLGFSVVSNQAWLFIPVAICFLCIWNQTVGIFYSAGCLAMAVLYGGHSAGLNTQLDVLALLLLFAAGGILYKLQTKQPSFMNKGVSFFLLLSLVLSSGMMMFQLSTGGQEAVNQWVSREMGSEIFAAFHGVESRPDEIKRVYESFVLPLFRISMVSWFAIGLSIGLLFNYLLLRLFGQFQKPRSRKHRRLWQQFSRWRAPDWILVPLVLGMGILALSHDELFPSSFSWSPWLGWNLTFLALFPAMMNGLSLYSYLIPRLSFFLLLLVMVVLIFNPIPVLVLSGLADLWFDFRKRIARIPPPEGQE